MAGNVVITVAPSNATCQRESDMRRTPCRVPASYTIIASDGLNESVSEDVCRSHMTGRLWPHIRFMEGT